MMLILVYDAEDGTPVADGLVSTWVDSAFSKSIAAGVNGVFQVSFSTENVLDEVRTRIAEQRMDPEHVSFVYDGQPVPINKYGNPEDWPKGFCNFSMDMLHRRVNAQMARRLAEKKAKEEQKNGN